jgi:hypothetical protein
MIVSVCLYVRVQTLSCLYQLASDDALCNSPAAGLKKPSRRGLVNGSLGKVGGKKRTDGLQQSDFMVL